MTPRASEGPRVPSGTVTPGSQSEGILRLQASRCRNGQGAKRPPRQRGDCPSLPRSARRTIFDDHRGTLVTQNRFIRAEVLGAAVAGTAQPPPLCPALSSLGLLSSSGGVWGSVSSPPVSPLSPAPAPLPLCLAHPLVFTRRLGAAGHGRGDFSSGGRDVLPAMGGPFWVRVLQGRGRRRKARPSGAAGSRDASWRGRGRMEPDVKMEMREGRGLRAGRTGADQSSKAGHCRERREVLLGFVTASSPGRPLPPNQEPSTRQTVSLHPRPACDE